MEILEIIFPILVIGFAGYLAARSKYLDFNECDAISKFVFSFLVPALFFIKTATVQIPEDMAWGFLFSYYAPIVLLYLFCVVMGKKVFGYNPAEQSVFGMGAAYPNIVMVGIPVCVYALGEEALLPLFILIALHNLTLFTIGFLVAEQNQLSMNSFFQSLVGILKKIITTPITGSLLAGYAVNLFNLGIYDPLESGLVLLGTAAIPASLFVLGTALFRYKISGDMRPAMLMVFLKMAALPLLVGLLAFQVFALEPLWAATAVLASASPTGINAYLFSQKYQACEAQIATSIVVSTLACILTLSLLISILRPFV